MMVKYSKPMVIVDQGLAEGVYADSGAGCYEASAYIHQRPETGITTSQSKQLILLLHLISSNYSNRAMSYELSHKVPACILSLFLDVMKPALSALTFLLLNAEMSFCTAATKVFLCCTVSGRSQIIPSIWSVITRLKSKAHFARTKFAAS